MKIYDICVKKPMLSIGFFFVTKDVKSHLYEKAIDMEIIQLYSCYKGIWRDNKC